MSKALTPSKQWGNLKKSMILAVCALYSFFGNSSLLGPSVYISIFSEQFGISPNKASGLISYANLAFGFGESTINEYMDSGGGGGRQLVDS